MRTNAGVLLSLIGVAVVGTSGAVGLTAIDRGGDETGLMLVCAAGILVGVLLMSGGAAKLSNRGRVYLGGGLTVSALGLAGYGIYRAALVWEDDAARIEQAELLAGFIGGGALLFGIGISMVFKNMEWGTDWADW